MKYHADVNDAVNHADRQTYQTWVWVVLHMQESAMLNQIKVDGVE